MTLAERAVAVGVPAAVEARHRVRDIVCNRAANMPA